MNNLGDLITIVFSSEAIADSEKTTNQVELPDGLVMASADRNRLEDDLEDFGG